MVKSRGISPTPTPREHGGPRAAVCRQQATVSRSASERAEAVDCLVVAKSSGRPLQVLDSQGGQLSTNSCPQNRSHARTVNVYKPPGDSSLHGRCKSGPTQHGRHLRRQRITQTGEKFPNRVRPRQATGLFQCPERERWYYCYG